jgi:hypothetical protein
MPVIQGSRDVQPGQSAKAHDEHMVIRKENGADIEETSACKSRTIRCLTKQGWACLNNFSGYFLYPHCHSFAQHQGLRQICK